MTPMTIASNAKSVSSGKPAVAPLVAMILVGCLSACGQDDPSPVDTADDVSISDVADAIVDVSPDGIELDLAVTDLVSVDADPQDAADASDITHGDAVESDQIPSDGGGEDAPGQIPPGTLRQILPSVVNKEHVFKGVWMSGPDDVHLVGADGVVVHYDGTEWTVRSEGVFANLNAVWGFAANDIWAVGHKGAILHFDGENWAEPGGCTADTDCEDSDPCTTETCDTTGLCSFSTQPGEGCCGGVSYQEGWDAGTLSGWNVVDLYGDAGGVVWQVVSYVGSNNIPRYVSPSHSLYFGIPNKPCVANPEAICPDYDTGNPVGATVTSPPFKLPKAATATVQFKAWIDVEPDPGFDVLTLSVVADGVATPVWAKTTASKNFQSIQADISSFGGKNIQLEFAFNSGDNFANTTEGVYIDDIQVSTTCGQLSAESVEFPTLFDVWGSSPTDIYAVGVSGTVIHNDGSIWKPVDFGSNQGPWDIQGLFGFGKDVTAVGAGGLILKLASDGTVTQEPSQNNGTLLAAWGNSPTDMYAVGQAGTILHNQGSGWVKEPVGTAADIQSVFGVGSFEVMAVGLGGTVLRRIDGLWQAEDAGVTFDLYDGWASGTKNIWVVGDQGTVLRNEGNGWTTVDPGVLAAFRTIWGASATDIWIAGGGGKIARFDGTQWADLSTADENDWFSIWAIKDLAIVAGDKGVILQKKGTGEWTEMRNPFAPAPITSLWGDGAKNVYAAGNGFVLHYDGNAEGDWEVFATVAVSTTWRGVCGSGPDNVILVGAGGVAMRYNGGSWAILPIEPDMSAEGEPIPVVDQLYGCWASSPEKAWAVGENGLVVELDGGAFVRSPNDYNISLRNVYAAAEDLIIAIGIEGFVSMSRGPGLPFVPIFSGSVAGLFGVFGTGLEDTYIVGDIGTILRFEPNWDAFAEGDE